MLMEVSLLNKILFTFTFVPLSSKYVIMALGKEMRKYVENVSQFKELIFVFNMTNSGDFEIYVDTFGNLPQCIHSHYWWPEILWLPPLFSSRVLEFLAVRREPRRKANLYKEERNLESTSTSHLRRKVFNT